MNKVEQQGMSLLGGLVVVILIGFFASIGFKLLPHYMDNRALEKIITGVEQGAATSSAQVRSVGDFYAHVDKNMQVNNIRDLSSRDIMEIRLEGAEFVAHLNYEVREKFIKNIDLVMSFDKEYRVRAQ